MASKFDFVIVGGGCAGVVLAARLTEDAGVKVLVIEAGGDLTADPRVNIPALWPQLQVTETEWQFKTVPRVKLTLTPSHKFDPLTLLAACYRRRWVTGSF